MAIYQKRNKGADFEVPPSFPPPYLHPLGIPLKDNNVKLIPLPQVQQTISPAPPSYKSHSSRSERSRRSRSRSPTKLVSFKRKSNLLLTETIFSLGQPVIKEVDQHRTPLQLTSAKNKSKVGYFSFN